MSLADLGFEMAQAITRDRSKSFYFASLSLPKAEKQAAYACYAFCRMCDDAVDGIPVPIAEARLARLEEDVRAMSNGVAQKDPISEAFRTVMASFAIPKEPVLELLRGMRMDLTKRRYKNWSELDEYCELAAGTVGRMMARIFRANEDAIEAAAALGRAMQLTNIARDVREDWLELGRIYLPQEALHAVGVTEGRIDAWSRERKLHGDRAEGFRSVLRQVLERADKLYLQGDRGVPSIPGRSPRIAVKLMRATYSEIGAVIASRHFDVFQSRASTSIIRKLTLVPQCLR